jgi:hypothetical protein
MSRDEDIERSIANSRLLEESLLNTAKLLESLDQSNRLQEAHEYNYLLQGMEELVGQFSDNQVGLQNEIRDILESSKNGLLTHEQLVEMVTQKHHAHE